MDPQDGKTTVATQTDDEPIETNSFAGHVKNLFATFYEEALTSVRFAAEYMAKILTVAWHAFRQKRKDLLKEDSDPKAQLIHTCVQAMNTEIIAAFRKQSFFINMPDWLKPLAELALEQTLDQIIDYFKK